jgi:hypothetical protein
MRSTALNTFRIERRVFFGNAGLRQGSNDVTGGSPSSSTRRGGCKPTGRNNGTQAGDSKQAKASKPTGCTANASANTGVAFARTLRAIINAIAIAVQLLVTAIPIIRIIGDDADL